MLVGTLGVSVVKGGGGDVNQKRGRPVGGGGGGGGSKRCVGGGRADASEMSAVVVKPVGDSC